MDYKIFLTRFGSSLFLALIILPTIIYYNKSLILILIILYFFIFYETYTYFKFRKKVIYLYLLSSLLASELYVLFFFDLSFFLVFILTIILLDTSSYIFGSLFGKKRLFPLISPNKTYFGLIFGYLISMIIIFLINIYFVFYYSIFKLLIISSLIIIFSLTGDLLESFFKRKSNIKDSSNLIPGHGGFFDRFDSFIFASYFLPLSIFL